MVRAADFGKGQTDIFALTLVWQGDLARYGKMCAAMGDFRRGSTEWHRLDVASATLAYELAVRIAKLELDAQRYRETVAAKEASCLQM